MDKKMTLKKVPTCWKIRTELPKKKNKTACNGLKKERRKGCIWNTLSQKGNDILGVVVYNHSFVPQGAVFGNTYPSICFPKKEKKKNVLSHKYCILLGGTGYVHFNIEGPKVKLLTSYDKQFSSHYIKEKLKLEASVLSLAIFCIFSSPNGIHSDLTLLINIYATLAAIH
jgi:hypothetical protein